MNTYAKRPSARPTTTTVRYFIAGGGADETRTLAVELAHGDRARNDFVLQLQREHRHEHCDEGGWNVLSRRAGICRGAPCRATFLCRFLRRGKPSVVHLKAAGE